MEIFTATAPADDKIPNEDWLFAAPELLIVLDGATARTDTGCSHGTAWYTGRRDADRFAIGSSGKQLALVRMKHAELAVRNTTGGYWVAAADPDVARHAYTGRAALARLRRVAVLTDGAARLVEPFGLVDWAGLLDLLGGAGPGEAIRRLRAAEATDPEGHRWPRNKRSDDATIVFASLKLLTLS